jgi:hypothetical protein
MQNNHQETAQFIVTGNKRQIASSFLRHVERLVSCSKEERLKRSHQRAWVLTPQDFDFSRPGTTPASKIQVQRMERVPMLWVNYKKVLQTRNPFRIDAETLRACLSAHKSFVGTVTLRPGPKDTDPSHVLTECLLFDVGLLGIKRWF